MMLTVLSGCFGGDAKEASATTTDSAPGGNGTGAENNSAPVASFTISFNGTVLEEVNGTITAPAGENLTFDASNSTDADGDNLTYTWDFNGTATADNVTTVYAFVNVTGNQTVTLTVSDGNLTGTANVTLVVGSAGAAPGTWLREDKQNFGTLTAQTALYNNGCGGAVSKDWVLVDAEENGTASAAIKVTVSLGAMSGNGVGGFTKLAFKDPAGKILKENNAGVAAKTITIDGPLPAGTYKVEASMCAATAHANTGSPALSGVATYVSV